MAVYSPDLWAARFLETVLRRAVGFVVWPWGAIRRASAWMNAVGFSSALAFAQYLFGIA